MGGENSRVYAYRAELWVYWVYMHSQCVCRTRRDDVKETNREGVGSVMEWMEWMFVSRLLTRAPCISSRLSRIRWHRYHPEEQHTRRPPAHQHIYHALLSPPLLCYLVPKPNSTYRAERKVIESCHIVVFSLSISEKRLIHPTK